MKINRHFNKRTNYIYKKIYTVYNNMMKRCYNTNYSGYKSYGGKGVRVCEEWKGNFNKFLEDIDKVEGFKLNLFLQGELQLDKDYKQQGVKNKIYSLDTCKFVTQEENLSYMNDTRQTFYVVSPIGDITKQIGLKRFCRDKDLNMSHAIQMLKGSKKRKSIKGYQFFYHYPNKSEINPRKTYKGISPTNDEIIFYSYNGLESYGVSPSVVRRKISKEDKTPTTNGWVVEKISDGFSLL